jgi:hypothetical protein
VFQQDGPGQTRVEIAGTLEIDATKLRGVPAILARPAARAAETFLVSRIQSNLVETAAAVARYLSGLPRT